MTSWINSLYNHSPILLQSSFLNLYAFKLNFERFGKKLERLLVWLKETERWSPNDLTFYQEERLRTIIKHAYDTVPFYRDKMRSCKLHPHDIRTLDDLPKFPVTTKEDIKNNLQRFISSKFTPRQLIHGHTSGTTGSPLDVYYDKGMVLMNNAVDWRQKCWAGLKLGERHAMLLGRITVPIGQKRPPFWRMNYVHNQLWLSAFHMSDDNLQYYVDKLEHFRPKVIEGYPSTLYILARYLNDKRLTLPLTAALTSSETLFPYQKEAIEKAFNCKIFDFYGHAERAIFATECSYHHGKHLNLEYGITEFVDQKGIPGPAGAAGRMTGTSLHNLGMPMIRYATDDLTSLKEHACTCGRTLPLMEAVTTKHEDIVITPDGRWISPSVLTHPFKPLKNILESQIVQEKPDAVTVKIIKTPSYNQQDSSLLIAGLKERLGNAVEIKLDFVTHIPRESSGKFRWVISKVPRP